MFTTGATVSLRLSGHFSTPTMLQLITVTNVTYLNNSSSRTKCFFLSHYMHTYPNHEAALASSTPNLSAVTDRMCPSRAVYGVAGHSLLLLPNTESKTEHCGTFTYDILLVKVGPILPCGAVLKRASPDGLGKDAE